MLTDIYKLIENKACTLTSLLLKIYKQCWLKVMATIIICNDLKPR